MNTSSENDANHQPTEEETMNRPKMNRPGIRAYAATTAIATLAALALSACNGPWNMEPAAGDGDPKLWISMLLVAERPLDTLWVERPLRLDRKADPAAPFVDPAASYVSVVEPESGDTLRFRPVPGRAAAWTAEDTAYRVKRGARYLLDARLRWNAAREFPSGSEWKTETLTAETKVPAAYALDSLAQAPVEALHPALAVGLPAALAVRARIDAAFRKSLYDRLDAIPNAGSLASRGVDEEAFTAYLAGKTVYRPLRREDTLHFIFDPAPSRDNAGNVLMRYALPLLLTQRVDTRDFGGLILSQRFDSARARIVDPMLKGIFASFGADLDSAALYQRGAIRPMTVMGAYTSGMRGYPDTLRVGNLQWGYTGRNVLRAYAVDPQYYQYYKGLIGSGAEGGGGLGGGSSRPQNVLRYSNVANGEGFFAGAVADSFAVNIRALRDTVAVSALREVWLKDQAN